MKSYRSLFSLIIIPFLAVSCQNVLNLLQQSQIKPPEVSIVNTSITGLSFAELNLLFDLNIKNTNGLAIKLQGLDYQLLINDNSFLSGNQNQGIEIAAYADNKVSLPLTLNLVDLYKTVASLINQDTSAYQLSCGLTFDLPVLGATRIPISKTGSIPLPKIPNVSLEGLKLNSLNLTGANLELKLNVKNANAFAVLFNNLNYGLTVNGVNWVQGQTVKGFSLNEKKNQTLTLPLSLNFIQIGSAVYQSLSSNKALSFKLNGDLNLAVPNLGIPQSTYSFDQSGETNLKK
jgi:LEA14-like dessication related protein